MFVPSLISTSTSTTPLVQQIRMEPGSGALNFVTIQDPAIFQNYSSYDGECLAVVWTKALSGATSSVIPSLSSMTMSL